MLIGQNSPSAKDDDAIGAAVAIGVFEHLDLVGRRLLGGGAIPLNLGDPHPAMRIDIDGRGIGDQRLAGKQRDVQPLGGMQRFQLLFGRALRDGLTGGKQDDIDEDAQGTQGRQEHPRAWHE